MIKRLTIISLVAIILVIVAYNNRFYYATLPIESISKKEVLHSINDSSEPIVKIANEDGYDWFITRSDQGEYREILKAMIGDHGWEFDTQDGSGYFFKKEDEMLIITTQMWTGEYVIVQVPEGWEE
ncbi:type II toxin-antitoxin system HicA family toxin [Sutcliffiella horikoshii]|uniref:type II toxin-antitoxin system HicA family toxin n=1 Tax=Sutcliffiella horikoshii TaxID=79883 RepID=UPI00384FD8F2